MMTTSLRDQLQQLGAAHDPLEAALLAAASDALACADELAQGGPSACWPQRRPITGADLHAFAQRALNEITQARAQHAYPLLVAAPPQALLVIAATHAALGRDANLAGVPTAVEKAVSYLIATSWIYDPVTDTLRIASPQSGEHYVVSARRCTRQDGRPCPAAADGRICWHRAALPLVQAALAPLRPFALAHLPPPSPTPADGPAPQFALGDTVFIRGSGNQRGRIDGIVFAPAQDERPATWRYRVAVPSRGTQRYDAAQLSAEPLIAEDATYQQYRQRGGQLAWPVWRSRWDAYQRLQTRAATQRNAPLPVAFDTLRAQLLLADELPQR
jgi:hypothetical protein